MNAHPNIHLAAETNGPEGNTAKLMKATRIHHILRQAAQALNQKSRASIIANSSEADPDMLDKLLVQFDAKKLSRRPLTQAA